jgi:dipeptidyl aminopeptidase/acylaminoacyl peptidase
VVDDALVYVTAGQTVMAVPFDSRSLRVTGPPTPVLDEISLGVLGGCRAALSREGTLAFERGSPKAQLVLRDSHGAERPLLAELRSYATPRFSPDGKRVAVSITSGGRTDVWIYDIAATTLTRLTTEGSLNDRPEWSRDGSRILFRSERGGRNGIWWQPADRSGPAVPLVVGDSADIFEGVLSPDDRAVVYQVDTAGENVFYRRLAGDTVPKPVANTPAQENSARVSPDGHWVAYVTDGSVNERQVVVQPFPGPGAQVQVSTSGGSEPVWSREGRRLFYRDAGNAQLIAASWEATPDFHVTAREVLFDDVYLQAPVSHAGYDSSPDGTHFLLLRSAESSQVFVVHNWRAEMRARMAKKPAP